MSGRPLPSLAGRRQALALARALVSDGLDLDVLGVPGSGRSAFLDAIGAACAEAQLRVIRIRGFAALAGNPLAALHAGILSASSAARLQPAERRPVSAVQNAVDALVAALGDGPGAVIVDDADLLDDTSLGVVAAVGGRAGVPVVRSLERRAAGRFALAPHVVELTPLDFGELGDALSRHLGGEVETGTLSRLFALSGGIVGLALTVAHVARLENRLVLRDGRWIATGELWSDTLRGATSRSLAGLDAAQRELIASLAQTGAGDLDTTIALAPDATALDDLRETGVLRVARIGQRRLVALDPPLLAEHLRRDRGDAPLDPGSALFVHLVQEHAREATSRPTDTERITADGVALLAAGRHTDALTGAQGGLEGARDALDAAAIRAHSLVAALCLTTAGRYPDAQRIIGAALALGEPTGAPADGEAHLGLLALESLTALRRGLPGAVEKADALVAASGCLPGLAARITVAWCTAQLQAFRGRPQDAADTLAAHAERLRADGVRFWAAWALLASIEVHPDDDRLALAGRWLAEERSELLEARLAFLQARRSQDGDAILGLVPRLTDTGAPGLAVAGYRLTADWARTSGDPLAAARIEAARDAFVSALPENGYDATRFAATAISLTEREQEIARLVADGQSNPQIAARLVLSVRTVESHLHRIMRKTAVSNRADLAALIRASAA